MTNTMVQGVVGALVAEFGAGHDVYVETVEQGLTEPCFIVTCVSPSNTRFMGARREVSFAFMVQFFPKDDLNKYASCNDVSDRLFFCLETVDLGERLVRGSNMTAQVIDDVLNFEVTYTFRVLDGEELPVMEEKEIYVKG